MIYFVRKCGGFNVGSAVSSGFPGVVLRLAGNVDDASLNASGKAAP